MREIAYEKIRDAVADAVIKANIFLPESTCSLLRNARQNETSAIAQEVYGIIEENIAIAAEKHLPLCQDTGTLVCMIKLGQEAHISGGLLRDAVNEGIAAGYEKGYLRKSIVSHPLQRVNTNDNTPAVIHIELCEGDIFEMRLLPKGGGAENMSALKMLPPAAGREGIIDFVLQTVKNAGANPCPPIIVGVGIGGNFEQCAWAAKKALARLDDEKAANSYDAELEQELLMKINQLGIGAQGFGGDITALQVNVETLPCHIASLPVAVNINCHVARHIHISL